MKSHFESNRRCNDACYANTTAVMCTGSDAPAHYFRQTDHLVEISLVITAGHETRLSLKSLKRLMASEPSVCLSALSIYRWMCSMAPFRCMKSLVMQKLTQLYARDLQDDASAFCGNCAIRSSAPRNIQTKSVYVPEQYGFVYVYAQLDLRFWSSPRWGLLRR